MRAALKGATGGGVILRTQVPEGMPFIDVNSEPWADPDLRSEWEVLLKGTVNGADVTYVSRWGFAMSTGSITWADVRRLVLAKGTRLEPECVEAARSVIPNDSTREAEVGFPLAAELLDVYQYRYQYIDEFRTGRYGWKGFFSALDRNDGRVGLLGINCSGWRFTIVTTDNLDTALACLCRPPSP